MAVGRCHLRLGWARVLRELWVLLLFVGVQHKPSPRGCSHSVPAARRRTVLSPGTQLSVPASAKSADPSALRGTQAQSQVYGGVTYYNTVQQQVQPKPSPPRRTSQPVTIKPPPPEVPSPRRESVRVARYRRGARDAAASLSHPKSTLFPRKS